MRFPNFLFYVLFIILAVISESFADEMVLQPDPVAGKDAGITTGYPDMNYGNFDNMSFNNGTVHGLIEFDISSLPTGATIDSAILELRENANCGSNQNSMEVHLNSASWSESTVTWNTAPPYDSSAIAINSGETSSCDWLTFDVTSAVDNWYNGSSNYGFRITGPSLSNGIKFIYSSDYIGNPSERPILRINYTPGQSQAIPTMNEWGIIVFTLLLSGSALWYMRRGVVL